MYGPLVIHMLPNSVHRTVLGALKTPVPVPCSDHAALQATSQGQVMGMARALHCMCESTLAVSRRGVGDVPRFGFFRLPPGVPRLAVRIFPARREYSRRTQHYRSTQGHDMVSLNEPL